MIDLYALGTIAFCWSGFAIYLHFEGVGNRWYGSQGGYWWFDHVTHFFSGAGVALWLVLVGALTIGATWWFIFGGFAIAASIWEVAEYIKGKPRDMWQSTRNMVYDLIFGGIGTLMVYVVFV